MIISIFGNKTPRISITCCCEPFQIEHCPIMTNLPRNVSALVQAEIVVQPISLPQKLGARLKWRI